MEKNTSGVHLGLDTHIHRNTSTHLAGNLTDVVQHTRTHARTYTETHPHTLPAISRMLSSTSVRTHAHPQKHIHTPCRQSHGCCSAHAYARTHIHRNTSTHLAGNPTDAVQHTRTHARLGLAKTVYMHRIPYMTVFLVVSCPNITIHTPYIYI